MFMSLRVWFPPKKDLTAWVLGCCPTGRGTLLSGPTDLMWGCELVMWNRGLRWHPTGSSAHEPASNLDPQRTMNKANKNLSCMRWLRRHFTGK